MLCCVINEKRRNHPDKTAIIFKNYKLTYLELDNWIQSTQQKIKKYKRISFIPYLSFESIVLIFAALRSNIKICLLNHRNPKDYHKKIEALFNPDISIHSLEALKKLAKNRLPKTLFAPTISNDPTLYIPTSGSSAGAKIACLSYNNFLSNALVVNQKLNFTSSDTWILSLPLFHVAGISTLFRVFSSNATVNIASDKDFYKVTGNFISLVPTQLNNVLDNFHLYQNKFKCILVGGASLSTSSFLNAKKLNLPIAISYGMTETASQILISKAPQLINGLYYLGFPSEHCEILLNDQMHLSVKGASVFYKYYNTEKPFDWFETQDILKYHKDYGYAFFARKNEMFISGGENIFPEEVEREILKCKNVEQVCVIGIEDDRFGHVPIAFILGKNYSIQEIKNHLLTILPKYKVPLQFFKIPLQFFNGLKCSRRNLKKFVKSNKNMFVNLNKFI